MSETATAAKQADAEDVMNVHYTHLHEINTKAITAIMAYINENRGEILKSIEAESVAQNDSEMKELTKGNMSIALLAFANVAIQEMSLKWKMLETIMNIAGKAQKDWDWVFQRMSDAQKSVEAAQAAKH